MKKRKVDWFLTGMVVAMVLASIWPEPGAHGGWLYPEILTKAGVALIFFLHGVALSFGALRAGALNWPVHLLVQGTAFGIFPLIGLALHATTSGWLTEDLRLGLFYLCALPSTVSSSVAMTAAARGNVPAAVFNATLSSILGVVLTPLWVGALLQSGAQTSGETFPLGKVILDLVIWLILPLGVGQCARPWLANWAKANKKLIQLADRTTILLLVYTSFCDSVAMGVWTRQGVLPVLATVIISVGLFSVVYRITGGASRVLRMPFEDQIAAIFCGSKKSLATGVPMAQLMFAGNPAIGVILLPIMIYHPLQLVICAVLASKWSTRPDPAQTAPASADSSTAEQQPATA